MRIGNPLRHNDHDRVAADVRAAPAYFSMRIEYDAVSLGVAPGEPWLARKRLLRRSGIRFTFGELRAGDAADQPGVTTEFVVDALEQLATRPFGPLAAVERAAVHTGDHQADDTWFHADSFCPI